MKNLTKLFLLFAFIAVSAVSRSQVFTANEFIDLTYKSQDQLKNVLEKKGYIFNSMEKNDMSENHVYTGNENMNVSIIIPNFEDGQNMISWEFVGMNNVYQKLEQELVSNGYKRLEREVRNGSRYISTTYQKPSISVTLSCDKTENSKGIYRLSTRYSSLSTY